MRTSGAGTARARAERPVDGWSPDEWSVNEYVDFLVDQATAVDLLQEAAEQARRQRLQAAEDAAYAARRGHDPGGRRRPRRRIDPAALVFRELAQAAERAETDYRDRHRRWAAWWCDSATRVLRVVSEGDDRGAADRRSLRVLDEATPGEVSRPDEDALPAPLPAADMDRLLDRMSARRLSSGDGDAIRRAHRRQLASWEQAEAPPPEQAPAPEHDEHDEQLESSLACAQAVTRALDHWRVSNYPR